MGSARNDRDAQALRWKPQMKNAAKRSRSLSSSGTAHVADQALSNIRIIDKLLAQGHGADDPYVAKLVGRSRPPATETATKCGRGPAAAPARSRRSILVASAAVTCAVAATSLALGMGGFSSRHTIAGKVWLERRPLGTAELRFHAADDAQEPATVVAARDGKFEIKGIPAGKYRVTVHPPAGSSVVSIATNYTQPESTPFQVHVNRDVHSLQLYAYKVVPTARKRTWAPGID